MKKKEALFYVLRYKGSMYLVLILLFSFFNFLIVQNKQDHILNQFSFEENSRLYTLFFIGFILINSSYHYIKLRRRKDPDVYLKAEHQAFSLKREINIHQHELDFLDKKINMLQVIAPIIVTFVLLQGVLDKLIRTDLQMEFGEIVAFTIILFYVFIYMENWHSYKFISVQLLKFENQLLQLEEFQTVTFSENLKETDLLL